MLDQRLQGPRHQAVVMVTHLPIAGVDAVAVKMVFRHGDVIMVRLVAAGTVTTACPVAASAGTTAGAIATRAGVTARAVWLRGAVAIGIFHGSTGAVVDAFLSVGTGAAGTESPRYVVGVFSNSTGVVVAMFPCSSSGGGAGGDSVWIVRLLIVVVVAANVWTAGGELAGAGSSGRHVDLWEEEQRYE